MVRTGAFSYNDEDWFEQSEICALGTRQSPIDIVTDDCVEIFEKKPLKFSGFENVPNSVEILNNIHAILFQPVYSDVNHPTITEGPLGNATYKLAQFHLHFGKDKNSGSEHLIDGIGGPMEVHLVFFNAKHGTFQVASEEIDGLAAVGFIFEVTKFFTKIFTKILNIFFQLSETASNIEIAKYLENIVTPNSSYDIPDKFTLSTIFGENLNSYYTYEGSLTTPPCTENLIWIVSQQPLQINQEDFVKFQSVQGAEGDMSGNFRKVQSLNRRRVYYYKGAASLNTISNFSKIGLLLVWLTYVLAKRL